MVAYRRSHLPNSTAPNTDKLTTKLTPSSSGDNAVVLKMFCKNGT